MSVIVTGGTGFLGSLLVRLLLERGEKVVIFDLFPNDKNLADVIDKLDLVRGDLAKFSNVLNLIQTHKPTTIYHLGAMMSVACDRDPESGIQANAVGTYYILEAARLFNVPQVIFASSIGVLSGANPNDKSLHDYSATRPNTIYGIAKLFSENLGLFYKRQHGIDFRSLRMPAVIGPGATSEGYIQYFNKAIEESAKGHPYAIYVRPDTRLPVVHVKDAARAFVDLAAVPEKSIKTVTYTIMGPVPSASAQDLVDLVRSKIPGAKLEFTVDEKIQALLDQVLRLPLEDGYARQEWGWKPKYDLSGIVDSFLGK